MHVQIELQSHELWPLTEGALWWPARKTLIVSDLHLEKGSSFARRGQHLPPYDTRTTLAQVQRLITRYQPKCVISLGDSFHDPRAHDRLSPHETEIVRDLTARTDWVWVEGNHDPDPPQHLGGRASKELHIGRLVFRHEPTGETGEIAGHLHPCARLAGRGGKLVRRRCFLTDGESLILPSMGAFTGGLNVLDPAFNVMNRPRFRVYMSGAERVFAVPLSRLVPDRRDRASHWRL
ncbi:MAG: phosphoesterase [Ponticaulis sp.]|nr:phosphoesterase [Ponticaulis sp.]|tara:strand:+ start:13794 stop:14498 length:705 start_codon:yes stop_codon:yes gene_type:complete